MTAFIGLGRMGAAIADRAIASGFPTTLYDVNPQAARGISGGRIATSIADAVADESVIIVTVNDDGQVIDAVTLIAAAAPVDAVVVIHATIAHPTLRTAIEIAGGSGLHVLDAGISGEKGHWSIPDLAVMVGGDVVAFERARPVMSTYASLVVHLGDSGAGLDAKLSLNMLRYLTFLLHGEAARLVNATGSSEHFAEIVNHVGATNYVEQIGSQARDAESVERRKLNVFVARKDLDAAAARAAEVGVELPLLTAGYPQLHRVWGLDAHLEEP